jgi:hypothetical protein
LIKKHEKKAKQKETSLKRHGSSAVFFRQNKGKKITFYLIKDGTFSSPLSCLTNPAQVRRLRGEEERE